VREPPTLARLEPGQLVETGRHAGAGPACVRTPLIRSHAGATWVAWREQPVDAKPGEDVPSSVRLASVGSTGQLASVVWQTEAHPDAGAEVWASDQGLVLVWGERVDTKLQPHEVGHSRLRLKQLSKTGQELQELELPTTSLTTGTAYLVTTLDEPARCSRGRPRNRSLRAMQAHLVFRLRPAMTSHASLNATFLNPGAMTLLKRGEPMSRFRTFSALALTLTVVPVVACGSDGRPLPPAEAASRQGQRVQKSLRTWGTTAEDAYAGLAPLEDRRRGHREDRSPELRGRLRSKWKGEAKALDAGLELKLVNPGCMLLCGSCIYDWSRRAPRAARIYPQHRETDPRPGEQTPDQDTATIPLSASAEGELCRYAQPRRAGLAGQFALDLRKGIHAVPRRQRNAPRTAASRRARPVSPVPTASATEKVCHATCAGDADCVPTGRWKCDGGLCRPAKPQ
jgi:hypothetical protein